MRAVCLHGWTARVVEYAQSSSVRGGLVPDGEYASIRGSQKCAHHADALPGRINTVEGWRCYTNRGFIGCPSVMLAGRWLAGVRDDPEAADQSIAASRLLRVRDHWHLLCPTITVHKANPLVILQSGLPLRVLQR